MKVTLTLSWARLITGGIILLVCGALGAFLLAWTGLYSIAASRGHPGWLNAFLEFGMRRSVEVNADRLETPDLDDPGLIALGAAHFSHGCASCHGAPGEPVNPIYQGMLPAPPSLSDHADEWQDHELHWIIKHGLQYAGMPGWAATERDDEVWALVAFLRVLPDLSAESYRNLAVGNTELDQPDTEEIILAGSTVSSLSTCARCHDTETAPPASKRVPRLGGQSKQYLLRALTDYRAGRRQSGFMEPVAAEIPLEEMDAIAAWFSARATPAFPPDALEGADLEAGRRIALSGDPARRVAACHACHGPDANVSYPRLAGQSAVWLENRLAIWRSSPPEKTAYSELMAKAVGKMTPEQMRDVSAWYARQSPPQPSAEAALQ